MNNSLIQKQIQSLRDELNLHNYNYYVLDNAVISDYDFDTTLRINLLKKSTASLNLDIIMIL